MIATKELHLSVIDQTVYRQYIKHLLIFPFPDISYADDVLHALRGGLSLALHHYPFLAGTLKADPSTGKLKASYPDPVRRDHGDILMTASYAMAANTKFNYGAMKSAGFPPAMLPSHAFCPLGLRNHAGLEDPYAEKGASATNGYGIPIMSAQATFVPSGMVMSIYTHHSAVDGGALDTLYETWSGYVKALNGGPGEITGLLTTTVQNYDSSLGRKALDIMACMPSGTPVPGCPELTTVTKKQIVRPLHSSSCTVVAKVLSISANRVSAIRTELGYITNTRISTFIALAAMMWTHVTHARAPSLQQGNYTTTTLGIAVDMRKRAGEEFAQDFMGNMALYATTDFDVGSILDVPSPELCYPAIASALHKTLSSIDANWFTKRLQYLSSVSDPSTVTQAFTYANGPDLFMTSWQHQGLNYAWSIPGTRDSKPTSIRKPSYLSEGGIRILPRRDEEERDYEILVCLEEGEMTRLVEGLRDLVKRVVAG
jgi:BAHD acyltransferase